jgi:menaquinone-specific isochorismate synthase
MSRLQPQHTTPLDDAPATAAAAAMAIACRLDALQPPAGRAFLRLEVRLEHADAMAWLRSAPAGSRRYFRDRQGRLELAGIGIAAADELGAHAAWAQHDAPGATGTAAAWFVAMPFDRARTRDPAWASFGTGACVLPEVELRRCGDAATLAVHVTGSTDRAALRASLEALARPADACVIEPALVRQDDPGDEERWMRAVESALGRIRSGEFRKLVLARRRRYRASAALEPVGILARLGARESRGFRFLVEAAPGRAFLGVTPERLVSRTGGNARSEAVAGTRPRGVDAAADRLLGESLQASTKDRAEHELVVERVRDALAACASTVRTDAQPRLLRLAYVQHLQTRVHAALRAGVGDVDLVAALHPTPAVAGSPVAAATEALRALEPFDRGLYAGPVGVVSRDGAEIAVAIRSALVEGDVLTAFAGAGIVDGSDAAEEWRETGHKLLAFEGLAR